MTFLARAPGPAELVIVAVVALIPLAALIIGFLVLMRITGPPQSKADAPKPTQSDPTTPEDP